VAHHQRPAALGQSLHHLPQRRAEQPRLPLHRSGSIARIASRSALFPAALAAWRQRFSTEDRSPAATVIGISPWPTARRKISSI
jgi:hypothetical protein